MIPALSVTELTRILKENIEENPFFSNVLVRGEVSNLTYHSSGHIYFTLKDKNAVLPSVFFKFSNMHLKFRIEEGMGIVAGGYVSIFEKQGKYQLIIKEAFPEGIGELQKQIEQLKKRLHNEGLFSSDRKKIPPLLPKRIGIVTSPTGAAFRDIVKVALRRFPNIEILLAPAKVQGEGSAEEISNAIMELNKSHWGVDVIIAGRGGGSFEDLMPFNEEITARAFARSKIPIISAVGHQIDHPISDDAADLFAPTPSAAAEIAVPEKNVLFDRINSYARRIEQSLIGRLRDGKTRVENITSSKIFRDPKTAVLGMRYISLEDIENRMIYNLKDRSHFCKTRLSGIPNLLTSVQHIVRTGKSNFESLVRALEHLSPLKVLSRGYAISADSSDSIIKSVEKIKKDDILKIYLSDGKIDCSVIDINRGDTFGKKIKSKTD